MKVQEMNLKPLLLMVAFGILLPGSFAQSLRLDSIYFDVGIEETQDFEERRKSIIRETNDQDQPLVIETQTYDGFTWENWRRREFTYSEDGDLTRLLISFWRSGVEEWDSFKERTFTYDENGNVLTKEVRVALGPGGSPVNTRRWEYTYQDDVLLTEQLLLAWEDGAWVNDSRQVWTYNGNDLTTQQRQQTWTGADWENVQRRVWDYMDGAPSMVTDQVYNVAEASWTNVSRVGYQLNDAGLWNMSVSQVWDAEMASWESTQRQLVDFGDDLVVDSVTEQKWEDDEWQNTLQSTLEFDGTTINRYQDRWDEDEMGWRSFGRYQVQLNELGLRVLEQGWQYWSGQLMDWFNLSSTDRRRFFYSEVVVNTDEPLPDASCLWPNPYQSGQRISCESLPKDGTIMLELINSAGQVVHQQALAGGTDFQIQANLPYGWYLTRLHHGGQLVHVQPLVFIP